MLVCGPKPPSVFAILPRSGLPPWSLLHIPHAKHFHFWITIKCFHVAHGWIPHKQPKGLIHQAATFFHLLVATLQCLHHLHHDINIQVGYLMLILARENYLELIHNLIVLLVHITSTIIVGVVPCNERFHHLGLRGTPLSLELGIHVVEYYATIGSLAKNEGCWVVEIGKHQGWYL